MTNQQNRFSTIDLATRVMAFALILTVLAWAAGPALEDMHWFTPPHEAQD